MSSGKHATIRRHRHDFLQLIRFPPDMIDNVRQAITRNWPNAILEEKQQEVDAFKFTLPHEASRAAISEPALMITILSELYQHGWHLIASVRVSKDSGGDSLFFKLDPALTSTVFFAVTFLHPCYLILNGAPVEIIQVVRQVFDKSQIKRKEKQRNEALFLFEFSDYGWYDKDKGIDFHRLLLDLLDAFTLSGWELHTTSIMTTKHSDGLDNWYFRRIRNETTRNNHATESF